tara:strand:+ start:344 stop:1654 length:1311 start_codon:yes stop_codon:yes gene_type:complete
MCRNGIMKIKLLINSVDRTSILVEDSWSIDEFDGSVLDTMELELDDTDNSVTIANDQDVVVEDNADANTRFFGGIVAELRVSPHGIGRRIFITAVDWKAILDRAYFTMAFDDDTDKTIIQNSFTEAGITEINTADLVQSARTIDKLVFRGTSLRQMMDVVSEITAWFWDVNKFKKLVYRPYGDVRSTIDFSDAANESTTWPYYNPNLIKDAGQFHKVIIHGAKKLSAITNQTYAGDGTRKRFTLSQDNVLSSGDYPLIVRGPEGSDPDIPTVDRNTNTNGSPTWTAQTVGVEEQDTGKDVLWNPAAGQVLWTTAPPNFADASWRITGRGFVAAAAIAEDLVASAAAGRTFTKVLVLPEVEDDDQAIDVANAFLREQGAKDRVSLTFTKDGLTVGDTVAVTSTVLGLTAVLYQIQQISMRNLGAEIYEYTALMRLPP